MIAVIADCTILFLSYLASLEINQYERLGQGIVFVAVLAISFVLVNAKIGLYHEVLRYLHQRVVGSLAMSAISSGIILAVMSSLMGHQLNPVGVTFYVVLLFTGSLVVRHIAREIFNTSSPSGAEPVLIYGAGSTGRQLAKSLSDSNQFAPVGFIDDAAQLHNLKVEGVKVHSPSTLEQVIIRTSAKKVLLAIPNASSRERREAIARIEPLNVELLTVPNLHDLVTGKAKLEQLNEISISDVLGRDSVPPVDQLLHRDITNKVVLVTGAGGSIGSELCRQIIRQCPSKLVLFEQSEFALYSINEELQGLVPSGCDCTVVPMLGSVQQASRMKAVMESFGVQTVYHAAAYKHVPLVELNVIEGVRNNIFGTKICAEAAIAAGIDKFVLVSTDKAVRPTNVMGATKRSAELVLQGLATTTHHTCFCMVRFGNVLGSSGSVVPLFRKQIHEGGPITLTHREITRYFMTIPEAAQLVIQAGAMAKGGDVFVLDMGEPIRIDDLAQRMIRLSGLEPFDAVTGHGDIDIQVSGLRPGEKLYEELLVGGDNFGTEHPKVMSAKEKMMEWEQLNELLSALDLACKDFNHSKIRRILLDLPTDFNPVDDIGDALYLELHNANLSAPKFNSPAFDEPSPGEGENSASVINLVRN
jgi:FlaA1/EpsC-like NDP-sugar epimerase